MLHNPNWDRPIVSQFVRFLYDQNPEDTYDWTDARHCACARFFGGGNWMVANEEVRKREGVNLNVIAYGRNMNDRGEWTYGALLQRLHESH